MIDSEKKSFRHVYFVYRERFWDDKINRNEKLDKSCFAGSNTLQVAASYSRARHCRSREIAECNRSLNHRDLFIQKRASKGSRRTSLWRASSTRSLSTRPPRYWESTLLNKRKVQEAHEEGGRHVRRRGIVGLKGKQFAWTNTQMERTSRRWRVLWRSRVAHVWTQLHGKKINWRQLHKMTVSIEI